MLGRPGGSGTYTPPKPGAGSELTTAGEIAAESTLPMDLTLAIAEAR